MSSDDYTCVDVTCTSTVQLGRVPPASDHGRPRSIAYGKVSTWPTWPRLREIPETNLLDVPATTPTPGDGTDNDAQDELGLEPPAISVDASPDWTTS